MREYTHEIATSSNHSGRLGCGGVDSGTLFDVRFGSLGCLGFRLQLSRLLGRPLRRLADLRVKELSNTVDTFRGHFLPTHHVGDVVDRSVIIYRRQLRKRGRECRLQLLLGLETV